MSPRETRYAFSKVIGYLKKSNTYMNTKYLKTNQLQKAAENKASKWRTKYSK